MMGRVPTKPGALSAFFPAPETTGNQVSVCGCSLCSRAQLSVLGLPEQAVLFSLSLKLETTLTWSREELESQLAGEPECTWITQEVYLCYMLAYFFA